MAWCYDAPMRRTTVYLDDDQYESLRGRAHVERVTISELIRDALTKERPQPKVRPVIGSRPAPKPKIDLVKALTTRDPETTGHVDEEGF